MSLVEVRVLILDIHCDGRKQVADILDNKSVHTINAHLANIRNRYRLQGHWSIHRFGVQNGFFNQGYYQGEYLFDGYDKLPFEKKP